MTLEEQLKTNGEEILKLSRERNKELQDLRRLVDPRNLCRDMGMHVSLERQQSAEVQNVCYEGQLLEVEKSFHYYGMITPETYQILKTEIIAKYDPKILEIYKQQEDLKKIQNVSRGW
jgi:hypothetical protein